MRFFFAKGREGGGGEGRAKDRIKVEKGRAEGRHVGKSKEMEETSDVALCF